MATYFSSTSFQPVQANLNSSQQFSISIPGGSSGEILSDYQIQFTFLTNKITQGAFTSVQTVKGSSIVFNLLNMFSSIRVIVGNEVIINSSTGAVLMNSRGYWKRALKQSSFCKGSYNAAILGSVNIAADGTAPNVKQVQINGFLSNGMNSVINSSFENLSFRDGSTNMAIPVCLLNGDYKSNIYTNHILAYQQIDVANASQTQKSVFIISLKDLFHDSLFSCQQPIYLSQQMKIEITLNPSSQFVQILDSTQQVTSIEAIPNQSNALFLADNNITNINVSLDSMFLQKKNPYNPVLLNTNIMIESLYSECFANTANQFQIPVSNRAYFLRSVIISIQELNTQLLYANGPTILSGGTANPPINPQNQSYSHFNGIVPQHIYQFSANGQNNQPLIKLLVDNHLICQLQNIGEIISFMTMNPNTDQIENHNLDNMKQHGLVEIPINMHLQPHLQKTIQLQLAGKTLNSTANIYVKYLQKYIIGPQLFTLNNIEI